MLVTAHFFEVTFQLQFRVLMRGTIMNQDGWTELLYFFDDPDTPCGVSLLATIDNFVAESMLGDSRLHPSNENQAPICLSARINIESQRAIIHIQKPATDEFLEIVRRLWGDSKISFNEWVAQIAGPNRGNLESNEIERLMRLQNFTPKPANDSHRYACA